MNSRYKWILILAIAIGFAGTYTSCSEEELINNGKPMISYVRVTNPASSDSLLTGAFQNNLIAIVGENLQDAQQVWFNDLRASVNPNYISRTSILTSTPGDVPKVIDNKMKIVFSNGDTLIHDFKIEINKPEINSMNSEYVNEGGVATIRGAFFYAPLTVTFTGGVTGELVTVEDNLLQVKVPAGAQPGPITIKSNFGEVKSVFWFRDNRNLFITNDPRTGWWGDGLIVDGSDPLAINGNFLRITKTITAWSWTEMLGGPATDFPISKNIPDDAFLHPEDYVLKFEANTFKPYNGNKIRIMIGEVTGDQKWDDAYFWEPPFDSKGQWETVVIPFKDIIAKRPVTPSTNGYGVKVWWLGDGSVDADIALDNFRVVSTKPVK